MLVFLGGFGFPVLAAGVRFRFCNWCARTFPVVLGWWNQPVAWRPSTTCTTPDRYSLRAPSRIDLFGPLALSGLRGVTYSIATLYGFPLARFASWPFCVCVSSLGSFSCRGLRISGLQEIDTVPACARLRRTLAAAKQAFTEHFSIVMINVEVAACCAPSAFRLMQSFKKPPGRSSTGSSEMTATSLRTKGETKKRTLKPSSVAATVSASTSAAAAIPRTIMPEALPDSSSSNNNRWHR